MEVKNLLTFTERGQLREWFERNHLSERSCWVACNRSKTAKPDTLPYLEIVEELARKWHTTYQIVNLLIFVVFFLLITSIIIVGGYLLL